MMHHPLNEATCVTTRERRPAIADNTYLLNPASEEAITLIIVIKYNTGKMNVEDGLEYLI